MDNSDKPAQEKPPWYLTKKAVFIGITLVGPLALPLLWLSGQFSFRSKVFLTITVIIGAILLFKLSTNALNMLTSQMKELKELGAY